MSKRKKESKFKTLDDALISYEKWNRNLDNLEELLELRQYISLQMVNMARDLRADELAFKKLKAEVSLMKISDKRINSKKVMYAATLDGKIAGTKFYVQTLKEVVNSIASWINQLTTR